MLLIRPVVTYGSEAWTFQEKDVEELRQFERKIIGPVHEQDGTWRTQRTFKLNVFINNTDIVRFIKSQRIGWLQHIH